MFHRIIVGCNHTPPSEDGLALGAMLAETTGAKLVVGYVYQQQPPWFSAGRPYQRALRAEIRRVFDAALKALPDALGAQTLALGSSSPARGLHDLAAGERADLIVLGSTHRGPAGRVLPGSVAEVLLAGAPCAVAIAPHGYSERESNRIATVGAAFDGSPEAEATLGHADRLARALGASLRGIAVAEPHWFGRNGEPDPLRDVLGRAMQTVGRSPDGDAMLLKGEPAAALAAAARDIDLLVAGSRGYGPLHHVLLGSVSARLLRRAPCPLIVVPRSVPAPASEPASAPASEPAERGATAAA